MIIETQVTLLGRLKTKYAIALEGERATYPYAVKAVLKCLSMHSNILDLEIGEAMDILKFTSGDKLSPMNLFNLFDE